MKTTTKKKNLTNIVNTAKIAGRTIATLAIVGFSAYVCIKGAKEAKIRENFYKSPQYLELVQKYEPRYQGIDTPFIRQHQIIDNEFKSEENTLRLKYFEMNK